MSSVSCGRGPGAAEDLPDVVRKERRQDCGHQEPQECEHSKQVALKSKKVPMNNMRLRKLCLEDMSRQETQSLDGFNSPTHQDGRDHQLADDCNSLTAENDHTITTTVAIWVSKTRKSSQFGLLMKASIWRRCCSLFSSERDL